MIIESSAPCRLSLFGGGTDIPSYSDLYGGMCISLATNLRAHTILYTGEDLFTIVRNEVPYHGELEFMHTIFTHFKMGSFHDVRFISKSDALLLSGLGTSAASVVATIGAISKAKGLKLTKAEIAETAWEIENKELGLYSGRQDTYASAYGGFNALAFSKNKVEVLPLDRKMIDQLLPALVLIHTGFTRENPKIQEGFKKLTKEQIEKLDQIKSIAEAALPPLQSGDIETIGALLDESWELKKKSNKGVSNAKIDAIYSKAMKLGAYGFRLCGAGGGGYALCIVNPNKKEKFIEELGCDWVDFEISFDGLLTRIL